MSSLPEISAIREAQQLLAKYFPPTPLVKAQSLSLAGANVFLKLETALPTGSFKPRGAMYALCKNLQRRKIDEVTTSSTGNHGAETAFAELWVCPPRFSCPTLPIRSNAKRLRTSALALFVMAATISLRHPRRQVNIHAGREFIC